MAELKEKKQMVVFSAQEPMDYAPDKKPHFFKVLMEGFQEQLRIPPNFVKHVPDKAACNATLCDVNGNRWPVLFYRTNDGTFFAGGWRRFVRDCELKESEFLVFRYDGDMQFTVLAFDTTACQKRTAVGADKDPSHDNSLRASNITTEELETMRGKRSAEDKFLSSNTPASKNLTKRSRTIIAEREASNFSSKFPHFVVEIGARHVTKGTIQVPAKFAREHLPAKRFHLVLRDPSTKSWIVTYTSGMFSAGWSAFVRANSIKVGDFCAFEMVGHSEFQVTIFRKC